MKTAFISVIALSFLAGMGAVGWYFYSGTWPFLGPPEGAPQIPVSASQDAPAPEAKVAPPIYLPLDPPFLVNFQIDGTLRFLQVSMEVMARSERAVQAVEDHMPHIRNNVLLLLGNQTLESIATLEAKELLRQSLLTEIQGVLMEVHGDPGIEALYFTAFVMQ